MIVSALMEIPDMLALFDFDYLEAYKLEVKCFRATLTDVEAIFNFFSKLWTEVILKKLRYTWICHNRKEFNCGIWENVRFYALRSAEKLNVIPGM